MDLLRIILKNAKDIKSLEKQVCCIENGCPDISATIGNIIECNADGLYAANSISIGETVTSGTPGSVLFIGTTGLLAEDNSHFNWVQSTQQLGIGTIPGASARVLIQGLGATISTNALKVQNSTGTLNTIFQDNGQVVINGSAGSSLPGLTVSSTGVTRILVAGTTNVGINIKNNSTITWGMAAYQANTGNFDFVFFNSQTGINSFFIDGDTDNMAIGFTAPTAKLHLPAGITTAGRAPLKFTSGSLLTTAETGAVEFLTDKAYLTITTGAARKEITLNDSALTPATMPVATTNGRLIDGPLSLVGSSPFDILTSTKPVQGVSFIVTSGPVLTTSGLNFTTSFLFQGSGTKILNFDTKTFFGSTITTPTAIVHIVAGTATANTAPLKLTAGTNLTTPENGAFEYDGTNLYFTTGGTRKTVTLV